MKKEIPLSKAYRMITPGPLVLVSSSYRGKDNIMAASWTMPLDFDPPKIIVEIGEGHLSYDYVLKSKEAVINIPAYTLLEKAVKCGCISGKKADKFKLLKLHKEKAKTVKAPLIKECIAHMEGKLIEVALAKKYGLFVFKITRALADTKAFKDRWIIENKEGKIIHHLGGDFFYTPAKLLKQERKIFIRGCPQRGQPLKIDTPK